MLSLLNCYNSRMLLVTDPDRRAAKTGLRLDHVLKLVFTDDWIHDPAAAGYHLGIGTSRVSRHRQFAIETVCDAEWKREAEVTRRFVLFGQQNNYIVMLGGGLFRRGCINRIDSNVFVGYGDVLFAAEEENLQVCVEFFRDQIVSSSKNEVCLHSWNVYKKPSAGLLTCPCLKNYQLDANFR